MSEALVGSWNVREYVFDAHGRALGIVRQKRRLTRTAEGRLRVSMTCDPDPAMEAFRGRHQLEISVSGSVRRYLGPDVVGQGIAHGDDLVLGRGVWPAFEHSFSSYAFVASEDRQLTGGCFHHAGAIAYRICGVGVPEGQEPSLEGPTWPGDIARTWTGRLRSTDTRGIAVRDMPASRDYRDRLVIGDGEELRFAPAGDKLRISGAIEGGPVLGFGKEYRWMTIFEAMCGDGPIEQTDLLDPARRLLVSIRRWLEADRIDVWRLEAR